MREKYEKMHVDVKTFIYFHIIHSVNIFKAQPLSLKTSEETGENLDSVESSQSIKHPHDK